MYVSLNIKGADLNPEKVSETLKTQASTAFKKGDRFGKKQSGTNKVRQFGGWFLNSSDIVESDDIDKHIDLVLSYLEKCSRKIANLEGVEKANVDIFFSLEASEEQSNMGNIKLSAKQLNILISHGLDLVISYDAYVEPS